MLIIRHATNQHILIDDCEICNNLGYNLHFRFDDSEIVVKCINNCVASLLFFKGTGNIKNPFNIRNCRTNPFT